MVRRNTSPVGYRRDGRPIWPIRGGSQDNPPPPSPDTTVLSISQDELTRKLTREKDQGRRAGVRELVDKLGFETADALTAFVATTRKAETEGRARLADLEQREAEVARREGIAERQRALLDLGVSSQDAADALTLLNDALGDNATPEEVQETAKAIADRRPAWFGTDSVKPAPAGPVGGPPARTPSQLRPGQAGRDMARRRGYLQP